MKIFSKISACNAQFQTTRNTVLKITFLHSYTNKNLQEKKYFFLGKKMNIKIFSKISAHNAQFQTRRNICFQK